MQLFNYINILHLFIYYSYIHKNIIKYKLKVAKCRQIEHFIIQTLEYSYVGIYTHIGTPMSTLHSRTLHTPTINATQIIARI